MQQNNKTYRATLIYPTGLTRIIDNVVNIIYEDSGKITMERDKDTIVYNGFYEIVEVKI